MDVFEPQVGKEILQIVQVAPQERVSGRILTDCRFDSASELGEIVELMRLTSFDGPSSDRGCAYSTDPNPIIKNGENRMWARVHKGNRETFYV